MNNNHMKAFIIKRYSKGDNLQLSEVSKPAVKDHDVLIEIHSASVNQISGPPDAAFAKEIGLSWLMKTAISFLSKKVKKQAQKLKVDYSFLFMKASGTQLEKISSLIDAEVIKPVIDSVFPFEKSNEAMAYVESGRSKGKVVVKVK